jgi:tetratricopeptide (TPR) repeat protein
MFYPIALLLALLLPGHPPTRPAALPPAGQSAFRRNADSLRQRNNMAVRLARQGQWADAERLLQPGDALPASDTLRYNLALLKGQRGAYAEARALLEPMGTFSNAALNAAIFRCQAGDLAQGLAELTTAAGPRAQLLYNRGLARWYLGEPAAARTDWAEALRLQPAQPAYRLAYGEALLAGGRAPEALQTYRPGRSAGTPELTLRSGYARLAQRRPAEARVAFETYLRGGHRAQTAAAQFGLGQVWYQLNEYPRAALAFEKAHRLDPTEVGALTGLGHARSSGGDTRGALAAYEQALQLRPDDPHARLGRAVVRYRLGQFKEALVDFGYARDLLTDDRPERVELLLMRGYCQLRTRHLHEAEADFATARRLAPRHALPCAGLGAVAIQRGAHRAARDYFDLALQRDPTLTAARVNRGNIQLHYDEYLAAARDFRLALTQDPRNLNAHNGLGVALIELDRLDEARARYDSLLARGHYRSLLYNSRGIVHAYLGLKHDKAGDPHAGRQSQARALLDFEHAQRLDSARRFYQNNLGNVYKTIERYDDAVRSYQGYLSKTAINNLGVLLATTDQFKASQHYLNVAVKLDTLSFVFRYNRAKLYREAFRDSATAMLRDLRRGEELSPSQSIAVKYSKDGYLTIFTFDYQYDEVPFVGTQPFPDLPAPAHPLPFLPVYDFLEMPAPPPAVPVRHSGRHPSGKRLRNPAHEPRRPAGTRCPGW